MRSITLVLMVLLIAAVTGAQSPPGTVKGVEKSVKGQSAPAPAAETPAATAPAGPRKRDPFVNPVREAGGAGIPCTGGGKRCLVIGETTLRGVVKSPTGMIAVVESNAQKTYFLRVNDAVYQGYVLRITGDSVVFRENVMDNLGHITPREVVKRVLAPEIS